VRQLLIGSQLAVSRVLRAGAGPFARTLMSLEHGNLGVNTSHVLQFSVAPDLNGSTPAQTRAFADRARGEIAALPGVRSVSISTIEIFARDDPSSNVTLEGYRPGNDDDAM